MGVTYNARNNCYSANIHGKQFVYAVNKHGPMAKLLAEQSMKDEKRHQHIFEEKDNDVIMKIYHVSTNNVYDIIVSKQDVPLIEKYKWYINVPQNARTLYVANDKLGKLHRYLMDAKENEIVDHINRNGLDNRRENLRITTASMNSRNMATKSCNKFGQNGVAYCPAEGKHAARYRVHWQDSEKKFRTKSFSIAKYPDALERAIAFRKQMEKENGYLA